MCIHLILKIFISSIENRIIFSLEQLTKMHQQQEFLMIKIRKSIKQIKKRLDNVNKMKQRKIKITERNIIKEKRIKNQRKYMHGFDRYVYDNSKRVKFLKWIYKGNV